MLDHRARHTQSASRQRSRAARMQCCNWDFLRGMQYTSKPRHPLVRRRNLLQRPGETELHLASVYGTVRET
jgi:hypothetical protein